MAKHRIIIDCDPGVDDAIALFLAFGSPDEIELVGITTVAGNVPLSNTTRNALRICALAGRADIPVYKGCANGIFPAPGRAGSVHGNDGLGGVDLPNAPFGVQSQHAVDFIIDTVRNAPGEITLCPIGPMTNIALALLKEPSIAQDIKEIVFMGGAAFRPGNSTPEAEFNIWVDPHAAEVVMSSGCRLTMFGLDVTGKAVVTRDRMAALRAQPNDVSQESADMLAHYGTGDPMLHDPCVVAHLIDPTLFSGVEARVEVECASPLTRGRTVAAVSERHRVGRPANCTVITDLDDARFFKLVFDRLRPL
ncbi:nucleoside hydrolase [Methylovirgula sp. 4M-Z18]|uniref:nucleoside hydrolase n=1 Tax=Methylovirgula sp. 4M-Z18 TaxID=2293567 RepID=UPI000E2EFA7D|nr:nucleoside hydrolase [Methylovirgula sp. 4M-Z18]